MSAISVDEERARKRLRKGTFSCWECKRRKVRCKYEDDQSICTGCVARGTPCLSQEFPEDHKVVPENTTNVGDRLSRVEKVLEKLVSKIGANEDGRVAADSLESLGIDVLQQSTSQENAPIYSLFDNAVFRSRHDEDRSSKSSSSIHTPVSLPEHHNIPPKLETITRYLVSMLPRQEIVDSIVKTGHGWWIVRRHAKPFIDQRYLGLDPVHTLSKRHPIIVARAMLYLIISVQQLPSSFDRSKLGFDPAVFMEKYHAAVSSRVLMDDELVGSVEGIECLTLQGIYHVNAARPRSAWLSMRRAINICQLLGIHRRSGRTSRETESMSATYLEEIFCLANAADRYLAVILGLPYGMADSQCEYNENSTEDRFQRHMLHMTCEVIDWNSAAPDFTRTLELDRRLDELGTTLPREWWELPVGPSSPLVSLGFGRTQNSSALFDRLMAQIWYYQLKALLHLPFMLRLEPRYERSAAVCLEACRELLNRYIFFRKSNEGCFCCKIVDFQAFTAATTLLLDLLGPARSRRIEYQQEKDYSWKLVRDVTSVLEDLAKEEKGNGDVVATQGLKVLKALQDNQAGGESNMKLVIPYFGTVTISRSLPTPGTTLASSGPNRKVIIPSNDPQDRNVGLSPHPPPYHQQLQQPQQMYSVSQERYIAQQQQYPQHFPTVSFTNDGMPRPEPEHESLWCDWLMQDRNDVPFQNMFDPNLGTSWYL